MGFIFKDIDNKPADPKSAHTRAMLLSLPFALMGIFALTLLAHDGLLGGLNRKHAMGLLSAAIVCGGLIALIFGINAKKMAMRTPVAKPVDDGKPWLRRGHVVVNPQGVKVQRSWFAFKKQQFFPATRIKTIASDIGATAGHAVYYDLKVHGSDGKEFILAKNLNNKPESDWLVRQMIAALQRAA